MNSELYIKKVDNSFIEIITKDSGIMQTIKDYYTFFAPNFYFDKRYKEKDPVTNMRKWDGKIRLLKNRRLPLGLLQSLIDKMKALNIDYELDPMLSDFYNMSGIPLSQTVEWVNSHKYPERPYEHQIKSLWLVNNMKRCIIVSPTGSGKSLTIYMMIQDMLEKGLMKNEKILLVVPGIQLVYQMAGDFKEYDFGIRNIGEMVHTISGGKEKVNDKQIYISTWQSIYDLPQEYFEPFKMIIIDEVHEAAAASMTCLAEKCTNASYRYGLTGTVQDFKTHQIMLTGTVGKIIRVETTSGLISKKILTPLKVFNFILKYKPNDRFLVKNADYEQEYKFILTHKERNKKICELLSKIKDNTLVLFSRIEHGQMIYETIKKLVGDKKAVIYVDGATSKEDREWVRSEMERHNDHILVASSQVFSRGINIKRIHNVCLISGGKSKIRLLQSIGRGLRLHETKDRLNVLDFVDDLRLKKYNFMYKHYTERLSYYKSEGFPYEEKIIELIGE